MMLASTPAHSQRDSDATGDLGSRLEAVGSGPADTLSSRTPARWWHWTVLAASLLILSVACLLKVRADGGVTVSGLNETRLPPLCMTNYLLGIRCPGCGLTRSFVHLAHGDWSAAWRMHRLGWLLALVVLAQIPYRIARLVAPHGPALPARCWTALGIGLACLLVGNWLYDAVCGNLLAR